MRRRHHRLAALSALAFVALVPPAAADCVTGLSQCVQRCDLKVKPESQQRPACASTCINNYQQCVRAEAIRNGTTGPLGTPGFTISPPGN